MKPKVYQIYTLTCPIDNVVRYVGCSMNANNRLKQHLSSPSGTEDKIRWLQLLSDKGLKPMLNVVEEHNSKDAAVLAELRIYNLFDSDILYCASPATCKYSINRRNELYEQVGHRNGVDLFSILMDPMIIHSKLAKELWPHQAQPHITLNNKLWQRKGLRFTEADESKAKEVLGALGERLVKWSKNR